MVRSSVFSSQASSSAVNTAKSGAAQALILLTTPTLSPTKHDSRGARVPRTLVTHQDLIWATITSTSSNHSCLSPPIPPVQLKTHLRPHLLIQILNLRAAAAVRNRPPTSTSSTTTLGVHLSRSSLAVLLLQNFLRHMSADPKIDLSPSPVLALLAIPTATPTASTLPIGDHGLVPPPGNLSLEPSDQLISRKIWHLGPGF